MMEDQVKSEAKTAIGMYVAVFLLGALLAVNVFFAYTTISLRAQVQKLSTDDMTIAQAINQLGSQVNQLSGGAVEVPVLSNKQPGDASTDGNGTK